VTSNRQITAAVDVQRLARREARAGAGEPDHRVERDSFRWPTARWRRAPQTMSIGISWSTTRRAAKELCVTSQCLGFGANGGGIGACTPTRSAMSRAESTRDRRQQRCSNLPETRATRCAPSALSSQPGLCWHRHRMRRHALQSAPYDRSVHVSARRSRNWRADGVI